MGRTRLLALIAVAAWSTAVSAGDWSALKRYQRTVTRPEFESFLANVYCPSGALTNYLGYGTNSVTVFSTSERTNALFTLRFSALSPSAPLPHFKRIALDPGHIGGQWARMEERFFERGKDCPVQEAVLNLTAARLLKTRLEAMGAQVFLTKDNFEPATDKRPEDFRLQAEQETASLYALDGGSQSFPQRRSVQTQPASHHRRRLLRGNWRRQGG